MKSYSIVDTRRPQQRGALFFWFGAECYVTDPTKGLLHGQVMCPQRTASQLMNIWLEKDQQRLSNVRSTVLYGQLQQERIRRLGKAGVVFHEATGICRAACEVRRHKHICESVETQH